MTTNNGLPLNFGRYLAVNLYAVYFKQRNKNEKEKESSMMLQARAIFA